MVNNRLNEGVGKKIVEALKKQSEIEIVPAEENDSAKNYSIPENSLEKEVMDTNFDEEVTFVEKITPLPSTAQEPISQPKFQTHPLFEKADTNMNFSQHPINIKQTPAINSTLNFAKDLDEFEVPTNIAVLKQLILQLPSGVTKQTGALIIRQTMEALGISMKSVLQEAQQVQENLNSSSRECQANIMEYKRQIVLLENQVQKYSKQYSALNDIISLFIQTEN